MRNGLVKTLYYSSLWCKMLLVIVLIMVYLFWNTTRNQREGFSQREKFVSKKGAEIYDSFYTNIYDELLFDKAKNEYEIGKIIQETVPTQESLILDVGSGTGDHVASFTEKDFKAVGLDSSPDMVARAREKYPELEFTVGNAMNAMIYPAHTFTHITCLYFTIYYIKDKYQFFKNCYEWLVPGGHLVIHLVNRNKFDPILNVADPLNFVSAQKYAKERITTSVVDFYDFKYKAKFILDKPNNTAVFDETFTDDKKKVRKHEHKLYMPSSKSVLTNAKDAGFIEHAKISLDPVQYEHQYLYILYKPN